MREITKRYWAEVFVVDTFIFPTEALAILARRKVDRPSSVGLVPATAGYIDPAGWDAIVVGQSKPIVRVKRQASSPRGSIRQSSASALTAPDLDNEPRAWAAIHPCPGWCVSVSGTESLF